MRRRCLSLTVVAALSLGGCGGGDDQDKIESKADFIAAADKICVQRDASSTKLATQIDSGHDLAKLSAALADIYDRAITELQAVSLPPGDARAGAQKYVKESVALREPVAQMKVASKDLEAAVKTKRPAEVQRAGRKLQVSVNTVQALGNVADQSARSYGMRSCGQSAPVNPVS